MSEQIDRLIVHYQKALLIKPDNAEIYINLAELYYKRGQLYKTVTACETALKIKPTLTGISKTLAGVLQQRGEVDAAFEMYNALGERLVKEGKLEEAIAAYGSAIELKPDAYQAYYRLGEILQRQSKLEEAISFYIKVINIEPLFKDAYYKLNYYLDEIHRLNKGKTKLGIKHNYANQENAATCFYNAVHRQPDFFLPYISLGKLLTLQGKLKAAISCYQTASYKGLLKSHPEFIQSYWDIKNSSQPNFFIIGTMKGGTTSLYSYLVHHPQILPAIEKEILFFREDNFELGLDWYLAHFPPIPKGSNFLTGEATPWYYAIFEVEKVATLFPNLKIILMLRNPLDRTFSHYQMFFSEGIDKRGFSEVITSEIEWLKNFSNFNKYEFNYWSREKGYLLMSLYLYFIEKWMAVFPKEQLLILKSEDFYANPAATLTQVFEFLGVPDYPLPEYPNYNPGSYNPISDDLRQILAEFFRPHNQKLEQYLGIKFNWE